jgi:hypothetical protein
MLGTNDSITSCDLRSNDVTAEGFAKLFMVQHSPALVTRKGKELTNVWPLDDREVQPLFNQARPLGGLRWRQHVSTPPIQTHLMH